jgi:hypothetical protein
VRDLGRGELVRLVYRLGHQQASGVLTITARGSRAEVFVLRRGGVVCGDTELAKRALIVRLVRLVAIAELHVVFEGGVSSYPPGAQQAVSLALWARNHLEAQLDNSVAEQLVRELAGMRLSVRAALAPSAPMCDEADRRVLAAMIQPRRLDQLWPLARTPRFRLLAFLYFLRAIDALEVEGIVAERSAPHRMRARSVDPQRTAAARLLGLELDQQADADAVKRAYRRIARALHPDLQPDVDDLRRKQLERRFAEVTAAYDLLGDGVH